MPSWFATIPPGLEAALVRELQSLGVRAQGLPGGARFEASLEAGALLATRLRTPSRLLLELARFPASSLDALAAGVRRVDWGPYLHPWTPLQVESSLSESHLRVREGVEQKVEHAIRDALRGPRVPGLRPRRPPQPQRLRVRIDQDEVTISLDAAGELLHFRGWRTEAGKAPIRENLAAALLYAAGWEPDEPLLDPFCGAGTIPIEAALLASGRPAWTSRAFTWQDWPALSRLEPPHTRGSSVEPAIFGSDRESRALAMATENARRARVQVRWSQLDVSAIEPPAPTGLVATNPPYGERLGQSVQGVYAAFGRSLRERFAGWRVIFLAPDAELARRVDRGVERLTTFSNGGLKVGLWVLDVG